MNLLCKLFFLCFSYLWFGGVESALAIDRKLKASTDQVLSDPVGISDFFQMFLGLILVVLLILGLSWLIKRINGFQGNMNGVLKVLSIISVSQREKVALIQVGDQQLLIGVSSGAVNTLLVLDEAIENTVSRDKKISFSEKLSAVLKGKADKL
ncbi:MAG: flagellar biosynthetic protein FliO [Gammaproteobacteria bacterium]